MIEKSFKRTYDLMSPQSSFTRAANKLLKEYKEVFGDVPDEDVLKAAEHIKNCDAVESLDYEFTHTFTSLGDEMGGGYTVKTTWEYHISAGADTDDYGNPVFYVDWYLFKGECYSAQIGARKISAADYRRFMQKCTAAKGKYRYFCTHRPPSGGCIPDGYVSYETYGRDARHIGEATYERLLDDREAANWGLTFDEGYEERRKYWLGVGND